MRIVAVMIVMMLVVCLQGYVIDDYHLTVGSCTDVNCASCPVSNSTCEQCVLLYYYFNGKCQECPSIIQSCKTCKDQNVITDPVVCLLCEDTFYLIPQNNACQLCSVKIDFCFNCTANADASVVTCSNCQNSYFLNGSICSSCGLDGCITCNYDGVTQNITCTACADNYVFVLGVCTPCSLAVTNCSICNKQTDASVPASCQTCEQAYFLNFGQCVNCTFAIPYCQFCQSNGTVSCSKCESSYYYNSTDITCNSCGIDNCDTCTANTTTSITCDKCLSNYYYNNVTCQFCNIDNCDTCTIDANNVSSCTGCLPQFYYSVNKCDKCGNILSNCLFCNQGLPINPVTCQQCVNGYFPNSATSCITCEQAVPKCQQCESIIITNTSTYLIYCQVCQETYYYLNSSCVLCGSQGCAACTYINASATLCERCLTGQYLNINNNCVTCDAGIANCVSCLPQDYGVNVITCLACLGGSYVLQVNICVNCASVITGCVNCSQDISSGAVSCVSCGGSPGDFVIQSSSCVACGTAINNCQSCLQDFIANVVTCSSCGGGQQVSSDQKSCVDASSSSTIIIVSAVVGGVVLIGAGFAIFKCVQKKKVEKESKEGVSLPEGEEYEKV